MKERKKFPVLAGTIILFLVVILLGYTGRAEAAGKVQLKNTTISVYKTVYTYNGRVQKPAVSVRYRGKKLSVNKDYTLVYSKGRKNPGVYTVAVKGKGSYSGTVKKTFRINPVGTKLASMQSPSGGTTLKLTLETAVEGGFRLSDPLFDAERFQRGEASDDQRSHQTYYDLKKPETGYPLLSADSELLPLCERKICLFRLVQTDSQNHSKENRLPKQWQYQQRQYKQQWKCRSPGFSE